MRNHARCLLLALTAACSSKNSPQPRSDDEPHERPEPRTKCDINALSKVSTELVELSPAHAADQVWAGVKAACGSAVTPAAAVVYERPSENSTALGNIDDRYRHMITLACPKWDEVSKAVAGAPPGQRAKLAYERCDFARFDVLSAAEVEPFNDPGLMTWAMHAWLLDQGVDAKTLRPITRALYAAERRGAVTHFLPPMVFPHAEGEPLTEPVMVAVSVDAVEADSKTMARIVRGQLDPKAKEGHNIVPLFEALSLEAEFTKDLAARKDVEWEGRVVLAVDGRTRFATLVDVMYTAGRAGFVKYGLVVEPADAMGYEMIPVEPPKLTVPVIPALGEGPKPAAADPAEHALGMTVQLDAGKVRWGSGQGNTVSESSGLPAEALAKFAADLVEAHPHAHQVIVSADDDEDVAKVVLVIAAVRPVLPDAVIIAGDANSWRFAPPSPADEDEAVGSLGALGDGAWNTDDDLGHHVGPSGIGIGNIGTIGGRPQADADGPKIPAGSVVLKMPAVSGSLDKEVVRRIVRRNLGQIRFCYHQGLQKDPKLTGGATIAFVIDTAGSVTAAKVEADTLGDGAVAACVAKTARRWKFPQPPEGIVEVSAPLAFAPK